MDQNFAGDETPTTQKNLASADHEETIVNSTPQSISKDLSNTSVADISRQTAPASTIPSSEPSLVEVFKCQWVGCMNRPAFTEAKELYDHLIGDHCEFPAGSPPLLCWWMPCEYFAPSGRHMRSHVHTHVAYYPHNCQYCGVAKKRMTDLRKHERSCLNAAGKYIETLEHLDREREQNKR
jgi:hypothetical protein